MASGSPCEEIYLDPHFTSIALLSLLDPSLRILDIGCGIGNAGSLIAPFVTNVVGVDRENSDAWT